MSTTTTSTQPLETAEGRGSIVRPRFTPGLLLLDEDLTAGVDYTRNLSRLLFRNLFGCGVICGLTVDGSEASGRCLTVTVQPGLALDCAGDPVQVRQPQSIIIKADCDRTLPDLVYVVVRRCEHDCLPRELACPPEAGGQSAVKTRTIDCYEIAVFDHYPADACGCPEQTPMPAGGAQSVAGAASTVKRGAAKPTPETPVSGIAARSSEQRETAGIPACYANDAAGKCFCECCTGKEWVLLAKLTPPQSTGTAGGGADSPQTTIKWIPDYSVSRFIRPVVLGEKPGWPGRS